MRRASFYAVARGKSVGVFKTWQNCSDSVNGFPGAKYQKFPTLEQANEFVELYRGKQCNLKDKTTLYNSSYEKLTTAGKVIAKKEHILRSMAQCSVTKKHGTAKFTNASLGQNVAILETRPLNSGMDLKSVDDGFTAIVYTDGACSRNGFVGAKAGFGVFWSDGHPDNVSAPVIGPPTNNRAEYLAVITALEKAISRNVRRLVVRTDSALLIQSMTKWLPKWRNNGWKTITGTDVRNRDLLERLDKLTTGNMAVKYEKVAGHSGDYGNDQADLLARRGAEMYTAEH